MAWLREDQIILPYQTIIIEAIYLSCIIFNFDYAPNFSAMNNTVEQCQHGDESQPARNSYQRLPHSVDSWFGLYHAAVVLSFLCSPALQNEIRVVHATDRHRGTQALWEIQAATFAWVL